MFELKRDQEYAQIASEEEPIREKRWFPYNRSIGCVFISVILAFCLIAGLLVLVYQGRRLRSEDERPTECGASLAEFEANGCVFDVLSYNWMPARCKDHATSEEFRSWLSDPRRNLGPWPFFMNMAEGSSLAENRIASEVDFGNRWDMEIWSSMEEHLAHCMFLFLHVSRVALGEAPLRTSDTLPHAEHCFHAIWKGLNGTWNLNEDWKANQRIEIETTNC
ncbi:hypothetical protein GQ44DRAFT_806023 [Phaeosphaeriaceae sp. PMI808]|nr:hypothetical protein GQ44DRAFT_806023 [Phaeosphaeriaceae sp. PMI808]